MNIIIFGCGNIYKKYKNNIEEPVNVLAIADNNKELWGKSTDNIKIIKPEEIHKYDVDYVVLMSDYAYSMREQLEECRIPKNKIIHYRDFFAKINDKRISYLSNVKKNEDAQSMLILSNTLGFHGVPLVSLSVAKIAINIGYKVTIASQGGDDRYIKKALDLGINIITYPFLQNIDNINWLKKYDRILVNSYPLCLTALKISKVKHVDFWLHETTSEYEFSKFWKDNIQNLLDEDTDIDIYAVSEKAKRNFLSVHHTKKFIDILPIGIEEFIKKPSKNKIFAVIGGLDSRKGQDILIDAIYNMSENVINQCMFFLVGEKTDSPFGKEINEKIYKLNNCILMGSRTRDQIADILERVDYVVVPSREETMSMVAIEAFMAGKICIVSDNCGIADYIVNGENGFIFKNEDYLALSKILTKCVESVEEYKTIGINAKQTYKKYFSINEFSKKLSEKKIL